MTDTPTTPPTPAPQPSPARKSGIGRWIKRLILTGLLLFVAGIAVLYFMRNGFVRAGVVRGGHFATGRNTSLETADLSLLAGVVSLDMLDIENMKDYKEKKLVTIKNTTVKIVPSSLFSDTVHVEDFSITGLELTLEQNGARNNINDLIQVLRANTPATAENSKESPGKKLKIDTISISGIVVHVRAAPIPSMDFKLDPMVIKDPTNPDGRLMKITDLVAKILLQVADQTIRSGKLPPEIDQQMKQLLAVTDKVKDLQKFGKAGEALLQGAATNPAGALKAGQDMLKDAQKDVQGIGNMFNQNKPTTTRGR